MTPFSHFKVVGYYIYRGTIGLCRLPVSDRPYMGAYLYDDRILLPLTDPGTSGQWDLYGSAGGKM